MRNETFRNLLRLNFFFAVLVMACPLHAEPMQILGAEEREKWQAVGRVNNAGFSQRKGCSGTLIAPDLVVTAAHCANAHGDVQPKLHYISGWYRGRFTAHRVSQEILIHPVYRFSSGTAKYAHDLALIRLADPIPRELVSPIPLLSGDAAPPETAWLLGYQNIRAHALGGHENCPVIQSSEQLSLYACEVVGGTSGGAVIEETENGPALAAVIVARQGGKGNALVVPVNTWLRDAWKEALLRENARE